MQYLPPFVCCQHMKGGFFLNPITCLSVYVDIMKHNNLIYRTLIGMMLAVVLLPACRTIDGIDSNSKPVSHEQWSALLDKHVDDNGFVDYKGFILDSTALNDYLHLLEKGYPNEKNWTREEILAYWINAYNAYTVQLIIRNYPIESIKDIKPGVAFINSVWDVQFINIEGQELDLNNIEHNILRKMEEPRIHFAINCASYSCPKLRNSAYTAENLNTQLDLAARDFINDPSRNNIKNGSAQLSSIFNWFTGDFTKNGSLKDFINQYSNNKIAADTPIEFMEYNWKLNEQNGGK